MTYLRSRSRNAPPSPSMTKLKVKLNHIVYHHKKVKISFVNLKSEIKAGFNETRDVFGALAEKLMILVNLKTDEMAEEGRASMVYMNVNEEDYTEKAIMAGNELLHKQKMQLMQLVQLLKKVESCVNSNRKNMFRDIDEHKENIHWVVQKAFTYVSAIKESSSDGQAYDITLKLLKVIYAHVCEALTSVEVGVNNLTKALAEQMCKPMIEYVKSCKGEMMNGTCPRLLDALEDMKEMVSGGRVELEQARNQARVAEERKIETLSMLKESEDKMKKMKQYLEFVINDKKESAPRNKLLAPPVEQKKDDKLLWDLLKKKQTCQQPESPFGPKELLPVGTSTRHLRSAIAKPSITHRPTTRSYGKLKTPSLDALLPLGSSPSVTRQMLLRKR